MSNWPSVALGDICELVGGGTPSRQVAEYFGGDIPWITPTDVTKLNGRYLNSGKETLTDTGLAKSSAKLLPRNTVLLTSRATIGHTAINTVPVSTNQGFANFICNQQIQPEYLAYVLEWKRDDLLSLASGATFKEISKSTLKRIEIPLPPLEEQRRIVMLLDRAADIRRRAEAARDKAGAIISALFLDMFGDPTTNPMDWDVVELGEACSIKATLRTPDPLDDADFIIIGPDSIEKKTGRLLNKPTVDEVKPISGKFQFSAGDVIYSKIRPKLRKATRLEEGGFCSADMYPLTPNAGVSGFFLLTYLLSDAFSRYAETNSTRAQMPKINREALFAHKLPLPPAPLMKAFEDTVGDIHATLARLNTACELSANTQTALTAEVFS